MFDMSKFAVLTNGSHILNSDSVNRILTLCSLIRGSIDGNVAFMIIVFFRFDMIALQ